MLCFCCCFLLLAVGGGALLEGRFRSMLCPFFPSLSLYSPVPFFPSNAPISVLPDYAHAHPTLPNSCGKLKRTIECSRTCKSRTYCKRELTPTFTLLKTHNCPFTTLYLPPTHPPADASTTHTNRYVRSSHRQTNVCLSVFACM
uniref:Putative secreted protein n=1 Tax=Anopheles triannulatus TaxID=58253 RepID=A0A2M4B341_9DIPT